MVSQVDVEMRGPSDKDRSGRVEDLVPVAMSAVSMAARPGSPIKAAVSARAAVLRDGRALTATELARAAGITAQTASGHLARLTAAGLLAMVRRVRALCHALPYLSH